MGENNLGADMIFRSIIVVFCLIGAVGCKVPNPYTMNPDPTLSDKHVKEFASVGIDSEQIVAKAGTFRHALKASSASPSDPALALTYMDTGVTVADIYCERYFRRLAVQHADQKAGRGALNIADAATSGILGATGAAADTISIVSVLFSAGEAQYENIDAAYLVSPNISFVERLVTEARQTLYQEIVSDGGPKNYAQAERRLIAYHKLCTFNGVNRLVDEAIAAGKPVVRSDSNTAARQRLSATAARGTLDALTNELAKDGTVWGYEQAAWLYAFYFLPRTSGDGVVDEIKRIFKDVLDRGALSSEQFLLNKTSDARPLLLSINRSSPLEESAARLAAGARENKNLRDEITTVLSANCVTPRTSTNDQNIKDLKDKVAAKFGSDQADQLVVCPAAGVPVAATKTEEVPSPTAPQPDDGTVSLLVTVGQ